MNFFVYIKADCIEPQLKKAIDEFAKRLSRYCKIKYMLVKEDIVSEKQLKKHTHCIVVKTGKDSISSEAFADKINQFAVQGVSNISFFIDCIPEGKELLEDAGNEGKVMLAENISLACVDFSVSVQAMILYEQVYRSFRIIHKEPYHK